MIKMCYRILLELYARAIDFSKVIRRVSSLNSEKAE